MDTITIGPLHLTISMLVWMISILAGLGFHRLWIKGRPDAAFLSTTIGNALLLWLLCWKLSPFLIDPSVLWYRPLSLLYFHGGLLASWLSGGLAVAYLIYVGRKRSVSIRTMLDSISVFLMGVYTVSVLLHLLWGEGNRLTLGLVLLIGGFSLFIIFNQKAQRRVLPVSQLALIFIILHAIITTLGSNFWEKADRAIIASTVGLKTGQQAPDIELLDMNGRTIKLSDLRGKKVILNFWATWCPPCQAEMPEMQKFYEINQDRGIVILAVNALNTELSSSKVEKWLQEKGYRFPVGFDSKGEAAQTYRVKAFPSTFIIGRF